MDSTDRVRRWSERHGLTLTDEQATTLVDQFLMSEADAAFRMKETCIQEVQDFRASIREKAEIAHNEMDREKTLHFSALAAASTILCNYFKEAKIPLETKIHRTESWTMTPEKNEPISLDRVRILKQLQEQEPVASATVTWYYGGGTTLFHTLHYNAPTHIESLDYHDWLVDHFEEVLFSLRMA